jgi:hypothetical protein
MVELQTMVRTEITIDGRSSFLAQGQDIGDLKRRIEGAMRTTGAFIEFTVVGNRNMSVLISPRSQVVFSVETVQYDPRDTGNDEEPFGGLYDL